MKEELIEYWKDSGIIKDKKLLDTFRAVPREYFIREDSKDSAYGDYPLPIGYEQTISQPTTIMIMSQALELKQNIKVLEIGAGSGYQAALIAKVIGNKGKVITTEIIPELADFAKNNLKKANICNVEVIHQDGSQGYEKEEPYQRIIVTAACPQIPPPLIEQLDDNGILVAPVGSLVYGQQMIKLKKKDNNITIKNLGNFVFVPLKGKYGYSKRN